METVEYGEIIKVQGMLDDEEINIVLGIEVNLESWGQCWMEFSPENSIKLIQLLNPISGSYYQIKTIDNLLKQKVKLMKHPKGGTYAPIAISQGLLDDWVFKKGWDQKCNGEPNETE